MKKRYTIYFILLVTLSLGCRMTEPGTPLPNTPVASQQLSLVLRLDKPAYQLGEAVKSTITIINTGVSTKVNIRFAEQCITHPHDENWEISFLYLDSKGQPYNRQECLLLDWAEPWYLEIKNGDEYVYPYNNLLDYYPLKEPGKYTIQAIYHNMYGSEDVWKGEIKSNIVTLTINP